MSKEQVTAKCTGCGNKSQIDPAKHFSSPISDCCYMPMLIVETKERIVDKSQPKKHSKHRQSKTR